MKIRYSEIERAFHLFEYDKNQRWVKCVYWSFKPAEAASESFLRPRYCSILLPVIPKNGGGGSRLNFG